MTNEKLINRNVADFKSKLKALLLVWRYGKSIERRGDIRILRKMPVLKLPGSSKVYFGDKVVLNSDFERSNTALTYRCTLVCGFSGIIEIDDNSMLNGVAITAYKKVSIGKNCQIASCTLITDTDFHPVNPELRLKQALGHKIDHGSVNKAEVKIGDNVWIGWGSIILKGVKIGDNSIVAAGSVVIDEVPANVIVAGNPAKVVKQI